MRISIVALSCSLFLSIAAHSAAIDYGQMDKRLSSGMDATPIAQQICSDVDADPIVRAAALHVVNGIGSARKEATKQLAALVKLRAVSQDAALLSDRDRLRQWAADAKKSPFYSDPGQKQESNWVGKSLEKLGKIELPKTDMSGPNLHLAAAPYFLIYVVWGVLIAILLFLLFLAFRHFSWKRNLQRKAKAMLAVDEPERSLDEWLSMADKLTAEGKFREAVRCLYLACLLRFDEHLVARFDRGQTNWEHLARIQASAKLPLGLDFEPPTKRFDTVWYGQRTRGMSDVDQFRDWYQRLTQTLAEVKR